MTACTWNTTCPREGTHRVEHTGFTGGSVEFVCDEHVRPAEAQVYRRSRGPGNHQASAGKSAVDES